MTTGEYIQLMLTMTPGQIIEIQTDLGNKRIEEIQGSVRINLFYTLKLGSSLSFFSKKMTTFSLRPVIPAVPHY
jgi:hypothetical protein